MNDAPSSMKESGLSAGLVIPTLNAAPFLPLLLECLQRQKPRQPIDILLVDSGSTDDTLAIASRASGVRTLHIDLFTHGSARNLGARTVAGDIIVFLSQDAIPANDTWLASLLTPMQDPLVAAVYSRQIPRGDATPMERFSLAASFPTAIPAGSPHVRKFPPGHKPTFRDALFSNVSSAVRRDIIVKFPFDETLILNEDRQLASDLLKAGHAIAYAPESLVIHSHNYTPMKVLRRYFDASHSLARLFPGHLSGESGAGSRSRIAREFAWVARTAPSWIPYYLVWLAAKCTGTILGRWAHRMPPSLAKILSLNPSYWTRPPHG